MGCASDPSLVYVDLNAVPRMAVEPQGTGWAARTSEGFESSQSIPGLEARSLFIGSAEDRAAEALAVYAETQRAAIEGVLVRLRASYLAEVDREEQRGLDQIGAEYEVWLDEAVEDLHDLFLDHVGETAELRYRLAWMVGLPDPDPESRNRPLTADKAARRAFDERRAMRDRLKEMDAEYKKAVRERFDGLATERARRTAELAASLEGRRQEARAAAQREAEAVTQEALAAMERTALDPEAQLPGVLGAASAVNSDPVSVAPWRAGDRRAESVDDLRAQLDVFLKVNGYRLTDSPTRGRQKTQEFIAWRRNYLAGR
ncbi:MAG: hypothetical protein IH945_07695 [Armatimonadetes bacterium]|nr:hypothetical protein [Armatimonadota bacterium]